MKLCLIFVLAVVAACAAPAGAYEFITAPNGKPITWYPDARPVPWWISANGSEDLAIENVEDRLLDVFSVWSRPECTTITSSYQGRTTHKAAIAYDSYNLIFFDEEGASPEIGGSATLAVTVPSFSYEGEIVDCDMAFNGRDYKWRLNHVTGSRIDMEFAVTALHETGHFFGIGHSNDPGAVMYDSYYGQVGGIMTNDDVAAICELYPADGVKPPAANSDLYCDDSGECLAIDRSDLPPDDDTGSAGGGGGGGSIGGGGSAGGGGGNTAGGSGGDTEGYVEPGGYPEPTDETPADDEDVLLEPIQSGTATGDGAAAGGDAGGCACGVVEGHDAGAGSLAWLLLVALTWGRRRQKRSCRPADR